MATLALVTLALYAQVIGHQFLGLDDEQYILDNAMVKRGLTAQGIAWAFTTYYAANWHPLTWLAHMLDWQLFGLNPGAHLLVNSLIHIANALLVFIFFRRTTGSSWRSAIVAALFAWHPLHVESVAWAAERKDTLSTLFGLLSLLAYVRYVKAPSPRSYTAVAIFLALGLLAKPMLVTWPFLMLLLDVWPLRRVTLVSVPSLLRDYPKLITEKLPLIALVVASSLITCLAQAHGGALRTTIDTPFAFRFPNSAISYVRYLWLTAWPHDLAVYYPSVAGRLMIPAAIGAVLLLGSVMVFCWTQRRARPYLLVGWLWFVGTLVPVIGLIQVGSQSMADRYHYIPSIGLFAALVFGLAEVMSARRLAPSVQGIVAAVPLLLCLPLTAMQISLWRDSETLFAHTLRVTPPNFLIEYNSGLLYGRRREFDRATEHFTRALAINPKDADALIGIGIARAQQHRFAEAVSNFQGAIAIQPASSRAHVQLGLVYANLNDNERAVAELRRGFELAPTDAEACSNLGLALLRLGQLPEAESQTRAAVQLAPANAQVHHNLGLLLLATGRTRESIPEFEAALRLKPELHIAAEYLARARQLLAAP